MKKYALAIIVAVLIAGGFTVFKVIEAQSVGQGVLYEPVYEYTASGLKWVGNSTTVINTVAPSRPGRTYLEITNYAASTTPQAIFCSVGGTPRVNGGLVIFASSTRTWERSHIPTAAVKCIAPNSTTTVIVTER